MKRGLQWVLCVAGGADLSSPGKQANQGPEPRMPRLPRQCLLSLVVVDCKQASLSVSSEGLKHSRLESGTYLKSLGWGEAGPT